MKVPRKAHLPARGTAPYRNGAPGIADELADWAAMFEGERVDLCRLIRVERGRHLGADAGFEAGGVYEGAPFVSVGAGRGPETAPDRHVGRLMAQDFHE